MLRLLVVITALAAAALTLSFCLRKGPAVPTEVEIEWPDAAPHDFQPPASSPPPPASTESASPDVTEPAPEPPTPEGPPDPEPPAGAAGATETP